MQCYDSTADQEANLRQLKTWLYKYGAITGFKADEYSDKLWNHNASIAWKLEKKLNKEGKAFLLRVGFDEDDADDIHHRYLRQALTDQCKR